MKRIPLSRGLEALVDDDEYDALMQYKWSASEVSPGHIYAMTRINKRTVYMHRMILQPPKGSPVDHIDTNGLNNQRHNIRVCTNAENGSHRKGPPSQNTSGYIGVSWYSRYGKWVATVTHHRRRTHVGYFDCPIEAARARDEKARELHGEFAFLNMKE